MKTCCENETKLNQIKIYKSAKFETRGKRRKESWKTQIYPVLGPQLLAHCWQITKLCKNHQVS